MYLSLFFVCLFLTACFWRNKDAYIYKHFGVDTPELLCAGAARMLSLADPVQTLTLKYSLSSLILLRKATEYIPSVEVQFFSLQHYDRRCNHRQASTHAQCFLVTRTSGSVGQRSVKSVHSGLCSQSSTQ